MADRIPTDHHRDEGGETESTSVVDGEHVDQVNPVRASSMSLHSDARTETTESTRSLVHRNLANERSKDSPSAVVHTEETDDVDERHREKSPASDTPAPSIGPVVLRDVKKRKKLERTCA